LIDLGKRRRVEGGFLGADKILSELKSGPSQKRVGLTTTGRPARTGAHIFDLAGAQVGHVTSGIPSPSTAKNVSMGYLPTVRLRFDFESVILNVF
jgi:aminomethyltransferase